jgi:glycosyltransferase involved in cell wall biosynthesis
MKVLVAHNFYSSAAPSGENTAVVRDVEVLRGAGHDVRELFRRSDDINLDALVRAGGGIRAVEPVRRLRELLRTGWRPDIVHVHNLFPLLTSSVVRLAADDGLPVVQTLHNYRRTCAAGTHFRDARVCEDCTATRVPWPAVIHGCYRGSRTQTIPVAVNQVLDKRVWDQLDAHIALTDYMRSRLVNDGVPAAAVVVRPTSIQDPGPPSSPGPNLLFVGRLTEEKGPMLLLEAWNRSTASASRKLEIIGDGPQAAEVAAKAAASTNVLFAGRQGPAAVESAMRRAATLVLPSLWYEGFPTVVTEAFAHGRAVLTCDNANLRTVVSGAGWSAEPTPGGLATAIDDVFSDDDRLARYGHHARARYESEMTPAESYRRLLAAYELAIGRRQQAS